MVTAALGAITKGEANLANMIANCATFQTITDSQDASEALDYIYFDSLPPPSSIRAEHTAAELESYRPFALVYSDESSAIKLIRRSVDASGHRFSEIGVLKFFVEIDVDLDDVGDPQEAERKVKNTFGLLLEDLAALAGRAGYIAAATIMFSGPARSHPDDVQDVGDFHCGWYEITYDNQGA
jgi:hypothetical protein